MRIVLSIIFVALVVILGVCTFFSYRSKKAIGKSLALLIFSLIPPIIGNLFIVSSPIEVLSTIGCYIYFIGMDVVMVALIKFTFDYCEITWHRKLIKTIAYIVLALDAIQMLVNLFTGHAFTMELINVFDSDYYRFVPHFGQTIHRIVDYVILGGAFITFIYKSIVTPKVYREKYVVILLAMIVVAAWQTFYIVSRTPIDISMTGFGVFGILVFLLVLYYRPLRLLDRMLAAITSKMPDAIIFFDVKGNTMWANKKAYEMFYIEERDIDHLADIIKDRVCDYEAKGFGWTNTFTTGDDNDITSYVVERQVIADDRGRIVGSYLSIRDNSDDQKAIQKETFNATHDTLTKIFNRAGYDEAFRNVNLSKTFLLLIDLDSFKEANDKRGHNVGDQVLIKVAEVIKKHFREEDYVCRIGGDEFAVIIPNADANTPKLVEERVEAINKDLRNEEDGLPGISVSAGGAFGRDAENAYELANNADHAMYSIKFNGKCGFALFKKR